MKTEFFFLNMFWLLFQWQQLYSNDTILAGGDFDYPPYTYIDINGEPAGLDVEILKALEKHLEVTFKFELTRWDTALVRLENGNIDIIAGIIYSEEREKKYSFSNPTHTMHYSAFCRRDLKVSDIHDLKDKRLLVLPGDIATENYLKSMGMLHKFTPVKSLPEAIHLIEQGAADYVMAPYSLGMEIINDGELQNVKPIESILLPSLYCFAVERNNLQLIARLNRGIDHLKSSGELTQIYEHWIKYHPEDQGKEKIIRYSLIASAIFLTLLMLAIVWWYILNQQVKKKTREVKEKEKNYLNIFHSNRDALLVLDEKGVIKDINQVSREMLQLKINDLQDKSFSGFLLPQEKLKFEKFLSNTHKGLDTFIEATLALHTNKKIPIDIKGALVKTQNITQVLIIVRDITIKKEAENISINARLAAEKANETKSHFVSMVSHELKNPLNALMGFVNLTRNIINPEARTYLNKISDTAETMQCIINQLLDISRLDAGKLEVKRSYFKLSDVLVQVRNNTLHLKKQGVAFVYDVQLSPNLMVYGDSLRLYQVLTNFISNALKFTERGSVTLLISEREKADRDNHKKLTFTIEDSGSGLSQMELVQIFEPFYQVANNNSDITGTGLGLSITRRFVEMMGGRIEASSTPGKGTSFSFTLNFTAHQEQESAHENPFKYIFLNVKSIETHENIARQLNEFDIQTLDYSPAKVPSEKDLVISDNKDLTGELQAYEIILVNSPAEIEDNISSKQHFLLMPLVAEEIPDLIAKMVKKPEVAFTDRGLLPEKKILIVDDDAMNREYISILLQNEGAIVHLARNGAEALEQTKQHAFNCILTDLHMPGMNAYELIRTFRKNKLFIPVIGLSADGEIEKAKALASGMVNFLVKPVSAEILVANVKEITDECCLYEYETTLNSLLISRGLSNFSGNKSTYILMAASFIKNFHHAPAEIEKHLASKNKEALKALIHNLISVTGIIGATDFSSYSRRMYTMLKDDPPLEKIPFKTYVGWLNDIIDEINYLVMINNAKTTA